MHLATAPSKSNAAYLAVDAAIADVRACAGPAAPPHLRDAHYPGAAALGHGSTTVYAHDAPNAVAAQQYPPDELVGRDYYAPTQFGHEKNVTRRLEILRGLVRGTSGGSRGRGTPPGSGATSRLPGPSRPPLHADYRERGRTTSTGNPLVDRSGNRAIYLTERTATQRRPARHGGAPLWTS